MIMFGYAGINQVLPGAHARMSLLAPLDNPCKKNIGRLPCAEGFLVCGTQVTKAPPPMGWSCPPGG